MGVFTSWNADLGPHSSSLVKVTPQEMVRYQAQVGALSGTARFENTAHGYTGSGYVTGLDTEGSSVGVAVSVEKSGTRELTFRVANGSGKATGLTVTVQDAHTGTAHGSSRVSVPASLSWSDWHDVSVPLHLEAGANLVEPECRRGRQSRSERRQLDDRLMDELTV